MARRILHLLPSLDYCSPVTQVALLREHLASDELEQHAAALQSRGGGGERLTRLGLNVQPMLRRFTWDPFAARRLRGLLRDLRPDVIHAWSVDAAVHAALSGFDRRVVVSAETLSAVPRWLRQREGAYVVDSPRGVPDTQAAQRDREELGLPTDVRLIGVVSRLVPSKRVKELIWAIDLVRVLHGNVWLVVIGDGPQRADLERFNELACQESRTLWLGEQTDVAALLPHLEVLWHAGEESKPPFAILEAMAAGLPVIAARSTGAEQAVQDGETGWLVDSADRAAWGKATIRLLEDEALRKQTGQAAQHYVADRFPLEPMLEAHRKAYGESMGATR